VLALSAKATACTLPAALFLILWLQKKPITMRRLMQIVPFVVLGIGWGYSQFGGNATIRERTAPCLPFSARSSESSWRAGLFGFT
jgi:hypothetical protein